jgi:hypothetical protein
MFKSWKSRAAVFAVAAAMAIPVLGIATPAGAAGNSDNAKLCQQGGWQSLQTDNGGTFANQGACVSYGAQGGQIFAPKATITVLVNTGNSYGVRIEFTGFHPNAPAPLIQADTGLVSLTHINTDSFNATGSYALSIQSTSGTCYGPRTVTASGTATDSFGLHASASMEVTIPACT